MGLLLLLFHLLPIMQFIIKIKMISFNFTPHLKLHDFNNFSVFLFSLSKFFHVLLLFLWQSEYFCENVMLTDFPNLQNCYCKLYFKGSFIKFAEHRFPCHLIKTIPRLTFASSSHLVLVSVHVFLVLVSNIPRISAVGSMELTTCHVLMKLEIDTDF